MCIIVLTSSYYYDIINLETNRKEDNMKILDEKESKATFSFNKTGGSNAKITIAKSWLDKLGIVKDERNIKLILKENEIILKKLQKTIDK